MRKIFVEYTCVKDRYTGIGKTVSVLCSMLEEVGYEIVRLTKADCDSSTSDFHYYNVFLPRYCKTHLEEGDIFLIPNNMGKFWILPHPETWVLMHDIIPLSRFGYRGLRRILYTHKIKRLKHARKIIVISETVKKQLIDILGIDQRKIRVLYWPVSSGKTDAPQKEITDKTSDRSYFLSIGTGEPRKNVEFLIENWNYLTDEKSELLLFGREWKNGSHHKLQALIDKTGGHGKIHIVGMITDRELDRLYRNAVAFIFPSLEEGFGLPPLEALNNGVPVILPKTPINYELYGSIAAFYSLGDIIELKQCIIQCQKESRIDRNKYINYCKRFSIDNFRRNIKQIFE